MLTEELEVLDSDSPLWSAVRPLLDAALRLEQGPCDYAWHGWNKRQIETFLAALPPVCALVVGVWEAASGEPELFGTENLVLGVVCEVGEAQVRSIRPFDSLTSADLKPVSQLEPGYEDALAIMRAVRAQVAPVAWALFTDNATWHEWLFGAADGQAAPDKGELLASLARQGRCVLMGSCVSHQ